MREPIYSTRSRTPTLQWAGPVLVIYLLALGFLGGEPLGVFVGVPLAIYVAFTFQTRYDLFKEALVIRYLWPRQKYIPMAAITGVQLIKVPLRGDTLLIRRAGSSSVLIRPRYPSELWAMLYERLEHGT